ncbi:hypothetical protein KMW28_21250 [Flammeovirga yaeyamensis]|uniref:Uncharacterized protein n=1 Tax=Flammeovirga yaeyamensis TaxID=367791 RepID=A0AAX1NCL3_9BACT|nr:hypothetical protein [Flammeovirga yaeyamensis]MBB3697120.1 hypothetical protein [Flammeovirga yaeyamensis]NMF33783.1 hypothetical protein [Flammeovirga yaeyamensis]QWG04952.1 hypothetical protein KMW28_21250 [Flammeovirga yaeyamensis]
MLLIFMYFFIGMWVTIVAVMYLNIVRREQKNMTVDLQAQDVQMLMEYDTMEYKRVTKEDIPEDFDIILLEVD